MSVVEHAERFPGAKRVCVPKARRIRGRKNMSVKRYTISGLAEACPLCIEGEKRKGAGRPIFQVTSDGGYTGPCCAPQLRQALPQRVATVQVVRPVRKEQAHRTAQVPGQVDGQLSGHAGLGLWIVKRNVEALGGRIFAKNRIGGGLSVTITLPHNAP